MFDVRPDSAVPIYEQIVSQLIYAIAAGAHTPGQTIPSARDLSKQLVVNPNTVSRAFQELEQLGIIVARRGVGMEVTSDGPKLCRQQRKTILRNRIRETLREAAQALPEDELRKLVDEELAKANGHKRDA